MSAMARRKKNPEIPDGMPGHLTVGAIPQVGARVMLTNGYDVVLVYNGPDGLDDGYGEFLYEDRALGKIISITLAYECVCPEEERLAAILEELEDGAPDIPEHERLESETGEDED